MEETNKYLYYCKHCDEFFSKDSIAPIVYHDCGNAAHSVDPTNPAATAQFKKQHYEQAPVTSEEETSSIGFSIKVASVLLAFIGCIYGVILMFSHNVSGGAFALILFLFLGLIGVGIGDLVCVVRHMDQKKKNKK